MAVFLDVVLIVIIGVITYFEAKRGFLRSLVDMVGTIMAFKLTIFLYPKTTLWLVKTLHFSGNIATVISCIFLFFGISCFFFIIGAAVYSITLLTLAPVFEEIFAAVCAFVSSCTILRFVLILTVSITTNKAIKAAIDNSLFAEQLLTLSWYHFIMKKLEPLTNPGEIYL